MKKVSGRMFFTVMWRGVCQAVAWFFGLFGYKKDGKYAKVIWGIFATSAAIFMAMLAFVAVVATIDDMKPRHSECDDPDCYENTFVSRDIYYHDHIDGRGYVFNSLTGERTIKHIAWIAKPLGDDSLVCYSDGKKRGYFNKFTGKVVIPAKFDHAWVFSDGLASVDEGGIIKFIDASGNVVIEPDLRYRPGMDGYVYHWGYCVVDSKDGNYQGLMDKAGKMVLAAEYENIQICQDSLICVDKGKEMGVFDKNLKPVLPLMECTIIPGNEYIEVIRPNNTVQKYDLVGNLINDFCIGYVRMLEYETDAVVYRKPERPEQDQPCQPVKDDESGWNNGIDDETSASYHPKATARLRAYSAGNCCEGLMTADGHIVTLPSYTNIEAIGSDLYLCTSDNSYSIVLNGKGQVVK